jgi:hypothetical protein
MTRTPAFDAGIAKARAVPIEREIDRRRIKLNGGKIERCGPCPRCQGTDRFSVNVKKGVFNCRQCCRITMTAGANTPTSSPLRCGTSQRQCASLSCPACPRKATSSIGRRQAAPSKNFML